MVAGMRNRRPTRGPGSGSNPRGAADEATILRSWPLVSSTVAVTEPDLSIVGVATSGSGHCRGHVYSEAREDPGALTRGKARCEQSVVDLACDRKAVECGCGEI